MAPEPIRWIYIKKLWIGRTAREVQQLINYIENKLNGGKGFKLSQVRAHIKRGVLTISYKDMHGVNRFQEDHIKQYVKFLYPQLLVDKVESKVALKYYWYSQVL